MSVAELKNNLHRLVVETDDPEILAQIAALFASLLGEGDWWDSLSNEEKRRIEQGEADAGAGQTVPYSQVKEKAKGILGNR
ncbi:MAG: hypothetical protein H6556_28170 [Lewinellaceae bacterium]|nr:hypothetical protein [Lewinellaceae bacterium]